MEAYGLEVEEELSTMATQHWTGGVWTGKWSYEQKEASMRQIRKVQTWKQERGPAGAVMCETRDLGFRWPYWHTLIFGNDIEIDMRCVCPKDAKRCCCRGPDQCTGKGGQQSMSAVVQLDYDEEMEPLHGMARWRQNTRFSAPPRGRS